MLWAPFWMLMMVLYQVYTFTVSCVTCFSFVFSFHLPHLIPLHLLHLFFFSAFIFGLFNKSFFSSRMFCVISAVALWLRYAGIISFHSKLCSFINNICCYFDECLLYVLRIYNNTYERAAVSICLIPHLCQSWYYFLAILLTFDALYQSKSVHNWHEESQFILLSTSYAFSMINEKCNLFRSQLTSSARRKKYVE